MPWSSGVVVGVPGTRRCRSRSGSVQLQPVARASCSVKPCSWSWSSSARSGVSGLRCCFAAGLVGSSRLAGAASAGRFSPWLAYCGGDACGRVDGGRCSAWWQPGALRGSPPERRGGCPRSSRGGVGAVDCVGVVCSWAIARGGDSSAVSGAPVTGGGGWVSSSWCCGCGVVGALSAGVYRCESCVHVSSPGTLPCWLPGRSSWPVCCEAWPSQVLRQWARAWLPRPQPGHL